MSRNEQWQISRDAAIAYDRYVGRYILGPWAPLLVEAAALVPGERVLDVACGTGVVARAAAQRVGGDGRVTGLDLNPGMIEVARGLPSHGAPIDWIERSALDLGLDDATIDVMLCQQGLQFFPDKGLALREMRRVLRPGGRVAISVWNSVGLYNAAVGNALAQLFGDGMASRFLASRRAPRGEELNALASEAGFSKITLTVARMDIHLPAVAMFSLKHLSATPVAAEIARLEPAVRARIGSIVENELAAYRVSDGVRYPEETRVLTASA